MIVPFKVEKYKPFPTSTGILLIHWHFLTTFPDRFEGKLWHVPRLSIIIWKEKRRCKFFIYKTTQSFKANWGLIKILAKQFIVMKTLCNLVDEIIKFFGIIFLVWRFFDEFLEKVKIRKSFGLIECVGARFELFRIRFFNDLMMGYFSF